MIAIDDIVLHRKSERYQKLKFLTLLRAKCLKRERTSVVSPTHRGYDVLSENLSLVWAKGPCCTFIGDGSFKRSEEYYDLGEFPCLNELIVD